MVMIASFGLSLSEFYLISEMNIFISLQSFIQKYYENLIKFQVCQFMGSIIKILENFVIKMH